MVLIESGGDNLTLTFSPALVDFFIYVIDVAAGDKIPRKNGPGISQSDILVINKTDLAPYVGASLEVMEHDSRLMRGDKPFVFTNCRTGEGIPALVDADPHDILFDLKLPDAAACASRGRATRARGPRSSRSACGAGARRVPGRAAADARAAPWARRGFLRLGFERRGDRTDPGRPRPPRAVPGAAGAVLGRGDARPCRACSSSRPRAACCRATGSTLEIDARPRRAGACDHAGGDQDPRDGRQLRGADAGDHARRRRLPRVPARPADPAPPRALPAATRGSRSRRPPRCSTRRSSCPGASTTSRTSSSARRCSHSPVARSGPTARTLFTEKFLVEPAQRPVRQTGVMGVRRLRQRDPADAEGQRRAHPRRGSAPRSTSRPAWPSAPAGCPTTPG